VLFAKRGAEKGPLPVDLEGKIGRNEMNPVRPACAEGKRLLPFLIRWNP
jgi:hypothetical protein